MLPLAIFCTAAYETVVQLTLKYKRDNEAALFRLTYETEDEIKMECALPNLLSKTKLDGYEARALTINEEVYCDGEMVSIPKAKQRIAAMKANIEFIEKFSFLEWGYKGIKAAGYQPDTYHCETE